MPAPLENRHLPPPLSISGPPSGRTALAEREVTLVGMGNDMATILEGQSRSICWKEELE